ncbi:glycosyltransferase family 4 protein [Pseudoroseicyclus sp. H15]
MQRLVVDTRELATHVFLADRMKREFCDCYGSVDSAILPNAYLVPAPGSSSLQRDVFSIGMISNLSREKGLDLFIDLVSSLRERGLRFSAELAGPVAREDKRLLDRAIQAFPEIVYHGPLYGAAKEQFFSALDVMIFPTRYRNEAQPIVIYEAFAHSVPVIAIARGCIAEQLTGTISALPDVATFEKEAAKLVEELAYSPEHLKELRQSVCLRLKADTEVAFDTIKSVYLQGIGGR